MSDVVQAQVYELEWADGGGEPIPVGQYVGKFLGLEPVPASEHDGKPMDAGIRFRFEVIDGEHKGRIAARIGPTRPTDKNSTGRLLASMGLTGKPGQRVNIKEMVGKAFSVIVGLSKSGRPCVEYAYPKQ